MYQGLENPLSWNLFIGSKIWNNKVYLKEVLHERKSIAAMHAIKNILHHKKWFAKNISNETLNYLAMF